MKNKLSRVVSARTPSKNDVLARIEARAYGIYEGRGCEHGHDLEDWLQAESETLLLLLLEDFRSTETAHSNEDVREPVTPVVGDRKKASRTPKTKSGLSKPAAGSRARQSA